MTELNEQTPLIPTIFQKLKNILKTFYKTRKHSQNLSSNLIRLIPRTPVSSDIYRTFIDHRDFPPKRIGREFNFQMFRRDERKLRNVPKLFPRLNGYLLQLREDNTAENIRNSRSDTPHFIPELLLF